MDWSSKVEQDNDNVISTYRIRGAYGMAADAMVGMAQEAFADGDDEVAFYLRAVALELRKKGEQEAREWEQIRKL